MAIMLPLRRSVIHRCSQWWSLQPRVPCQYPQKYKHWQHAAVSSRLSSVGIVRQLSAHVGSADVNDALTTDCDLISVAAHGYFQHGLAVPGVFKAGALAIDTQKHQLYVARDDYALVQDLARRLDPPSRLELGLPLSLKIELGGDQDFQFTSQITDWSGKDVHYENIEISHGCKNGFHVIAQGHELRHFGPSDVSDLQLFIDSLPYGAFVMMAGRIFGDEVTSWNAHPMMQVAHNDQDHWLGWPGVALCVESSVFTVQHEQFHRITAKTLKTQKNKYRTSKPSNAALLAIQTLGFSEKSSAACRHGDLLAMVAVKGRHDLTQILHLPAVHANIGLRRSQVEHEHSGYVAIKTHQQLGEPIGGLAIDGRRLLVSTPSRLISRCLDSGSAEQLVSPDEWAGNSGGIQVDQDKGLLYFNTKSEICALDVTSGNSRPIASSNVALPEPRSTVVHYEWLIVSHARGVTVIDQGRAAGLQIADCTFATKAVVIGDRIAVLANRDVHLVEWTIPEIADRLAASLGGSLAERPPSLQHWLGLGIDGFPVVGLPPSKTALSGICDGIEYGGRFFLSHDAGVFYLPLSYSSATVANSSQSAADDGFPAEFVAVIPSYATSQRADPPMTASSPFELVPMTKHPSAAALLMSPVVKWRESTTWTFRVPLQKSDVSIICGLAPEEECFANADMPLVAHQSKPRVDGILIHKPDPWDDQTHAIRLHQVVVGESGKSIWVQGSDIIKRVLQDLGIWSSSNSEGFFLGDHGGGMEICLKGTCSLNFRGGVTYRLESASLHSLDLKFPMDIPLIGEPLEPFTLGQSRRIRFYVGALASSPEAAPVEGQVVPPVAALDFNPEHYPSMYH